MKERGNKKSVQAMNNNLTFVDGTLLERILSNKINKNNKSGVKGVNLLKQNGRKPMWRAAITFQGIRYQKYFRYDEFDLAVAQRKTWEEEFFKPVIEKHYHHKG